ncbi:MULTISPECIES: NmrA family transcriptional regulator [unclassified Streptomyces]|uniref:NmrA family transcriptional regulator n=1 Tax=unclassified Streptomyces TaxID=2593676 RepID=UPI0006FB4DEA|nr:MULTISPECIES: NmrA family transcriptional regulator [unclassified Streptomyces]KQX50940.1 NmrA family transcriptional regulator [Streptomyces sp. Root1304]KRA85106.1 NmrA family transcriptional regulator [Streptomyces sp. Root66D1]
MTTQTNNSQNNHGTHDAPSTEKTPGTQDGGTAPTVLVTSATGKTGRRVAERLAARGATVRAGSRTGATPFDWEAPETWAPALRGADSAYVAYYPDLAAPGAAEAMRTFGRLAAEAGVGRLTLLSGRGEPEAVAAEEALREAADGVELAVVRASFFAQNFNEGLLAEGVAEGAVVFPAGDTAEPFIDADDLADVVVETLSDDRHAGRTHELTGPRPVGFAEVAAEIARASGRPVVYAPVSEAEYAGMLAGFGLPVPEAEWLANLFATLLDGHNASVTDGVKRVLGRDPRAFADFATEAWDGPASAS